MNTSGNEYLLRGKPRFPNDGTVDVFVLSGQSHAEGQGNAWEISQKDIVRFAETALRFNSTGTPAGGVPAADWGGLQIGITSDGTFSGGPDFGVETSISAYYYANYLKPAYWVKSAFGGVGISEVLRGGGGTFHPDPAFSIYPNLTLPLIGAINRLNTQYGIQFSDCRFHLIWIQGETDANYSPDDSQYQAHWTRIHTDWVADMDAAFPGFEFASETDFLIGYDFDTYPDAGITLVNDAKIAWAALDTAKRRYAVVDNKMDILANNHYSGNAMVHIGAKIFEQIFLEDPPLPPSPPDTEAPSAPQNLVASSITSASMQLDWDASTDNVGVTSYNVYVDSLLAGSPATNSFSLFGLSELTQYSIYVTAEDSSGNESTASNTITPTTIAAAALGTPTGLAASNIQAGQADLTWNAASGAVGYRLYKEFSETGYDMYGYHYVATTVGTSATPIGLGSSLDWNFKVVAVDAQGNESPDSNIVAVTSGTAANVYATSQTVFGGSGPFTADYEFNNPIGRGDPINDTQVQACHIWQDSQNGTPIIFDGATFRTKDYALFSDITNSNVEIRNCVFLFENPNIAGGTEGKHIHSYLSDRMIFENNFCVGGRGVWINEGNPGGEYHVRNNIFLDIHGLVSDGANGWTNASDPNPENSQCSMLADIPATATSSVNFNYTFSRPGFSKIEDCHSMFGVTGTVGTPKPYRGNCVNGRYDNRDVDASGGSGTAFQVESDTRYVDLYENVIVSCGGNPMSTSWAKFIEWYDNILVSRPYIPTDPTVQIGFHWRGHQIGNEFWTPVANPVTDSNGHDNLIWYPRSLGGQTVGYTYSDMMYIRPDATNSSEYNNTVNDFAPMPTHQEEADEVAAWWDYIRAQGQVVGPGIL